MERLKKASMKSSATIVRRGDHVVEYPLDRE